jgi:allantoicase
MSLSDHQIFMLKHFALGWKFRLKNDKPGSWITYWSLRRRKLVDAGSVVTKLGREVLAKELDLQAKRKEKNEH